MINASCPVMFCAGVPFAVQGSCAYEAMFCFLAQSVVLGVSIIFAVILVVWWYSRKMLKKDVGGRKE